MTTEHKPHSELVARIRSALGASGEQERRGRTALDELIEQLEMALKAGGWAAAEKAARRADELHEQLEALQEQIAIARDMCARPAGTCFAALRESNPASEPEGA